MRRDEKTCITVGALYRSESTEYVPGWQHCPASEVPSGLERTHRIENSIDYQCVSAPHGDISQPLRRNTAYLISEMLICVSHFSAASADFIRAWLYVLMKDIRMQ